MSQIWKFTIAFSSSHFPTIPKSQEKNAYILKTKKLLTLNKKHFSSFFKGLSVVRKCVRLKSKLSRKLYKAIYFAFDEIFHRKTEYSFYKNKTLIWVN